MDRFGHIPRWSSALLLAGFVGVFLGGCISGRVLEGYPGYPFLSFDVPVSVDTAFFAAQRALGAEGLELDYSEHSTGLIATRPAAQDGTELFLNLVVDSAAAAGSRVWVAGYRPVPGGARRISPLAEEDWAALRAITHRLSQRMGGTTPAEPPAPDEPPAPEG